jgi:hypothetical protein
MYKQRDISPDIDPLFKGRRGYVVESPIAPSAPLSEEGWGLIREPWFGLATAMDNAFHMWLLNPNSISLLIIVLAEIFGQMFSLNLINNHIAFNGSV